MKIKNYIIFLNNLLLFFIFYYIIQFTFNNIIFKEKINYNLSLFEPIKTISSKDSIKEKTFDYSAIFKENPFSKVNYQQEQKSNINSDVNELLPEPEKANIFIPLDKSLLGTIIRSNNNSIALIKDKKANKIKTFYINDMIDDGKIIAVERNIVYVKVGDDIQILTNKEIERNNKLEIKSKKEKKTAAGTRVDVVLNRNEVNRKIFNNLNNILNTAFIKPQLKGSTIIGFKIYNIKPGSVIAELGIENGDIIRRVNNKSITNIEEAFKVWQYVKEEPEIDVELERKGKTLNLHFSIKE